MQKLSGVFTPFQFFMRMLVQLFGVTGGRNDLRPPEFFSLCKNPSF